MSIWSKLGLADKDMISVLQKEVIALREENAGLIQKQTDKVSQVLKEQTEFSKENLQILMDDMKQLSATANVIDEKSDGLKVGIERQLQLAIKNSDQIARISELIHTFSSEQKQHMEKLRKLEDIRELLDKISKELSLERQHLNETNQKNFIEITKEFTEVKCYLNNLMTETDNKGKHLQTIEEYLSSLWEAMKLVWINDLMEEYGKSE